MGMEALFGIGALVLGAVLLFAMLRNRQNPRNKQIGEAATREQYKHPGSYDPDGFRRGLKPNPDGSVPRKSGEGLQ